MVKDDDMMNVVVVLCLWCQREPFFVEVPVPVVVILVGSQQVRARNSFPKATYPFQALSGRGPKRYHIKKLTGGAGFCFV